MLQYTFEDMKRMDRSQLGNMVIPDYPSYWLESRTATRRQRDHAYDRKENW